MPQDTLSIPTQKIQAVADTIAAPVSDVAGAKMTGLMAGHDMTMWGLFMAC